MVAVPDLANLGPARTAAVRASADPAVRALVGTEVAVSYWLPVRSEPVLPP